MENSWSPKYKFQFKLKVIWNSAGECKPAKLSTIFNQLGIENAGTLDAFVEEFYKQFRWSQTSLLKIYSKLFVTIWRRESPYTLFLIQPFTLDTLIKFFLDYKVKKRRKLSKFNLNKNNFLAFKLMFLRNIRWSSECGNILKLGHSIKSLSAINGSFKTYAKRAQMLGRKINFRERTRGKKLEEYF